MLKVSTGFTTKLLGPASFESIFDRGGIYLYAGLRADSPNAPAPTAPIGVISKQGMAWNPSNIGYGLKFTRSGPYVFFGDSDAQLVPDANATASWWRLVAPFDDGEPSYTQCRIDGDCGLQSAPTGQELLLPSLALEIGTAYPVGYFLYTIPPIIGA